MRDGEQDRPQLHLPHDSVGHGWGYFTLNFTEPTGALTVVPDGERDCLIMPVQQN